MAPKLETTQLLINTKMDNWIVIVYEKLCCNRKKMNYCFTKHDESQNNSVWKKLNKKYYILYDSINTKF